MTAVCCIVSELQHLMHGRTAQSLTLVAQLTTLLAVCLSWACAVQVSDAFTEADITSSKQAPACKHTAGLRLLSSGREVVPALGFAWANCVNTRLFMSRTELTIPSTFSHTDEQSISVHTPVSLPVRYMQIVFSPCLPQDTCLYVVGQFGLHGIDRASIDMTAQQPSEVLSRPLQPLTGQADLDERKALGEVAGKVPRVSYAEPENSLHGANGLPAISASAERFTSQTGSRLATGVFAPM